MKKVITVLVVLSLLYTVGTVLLLMNEEALYNNLNLLDMIEYSKLWMILGLILLLSIIIIGGMWVRSLLKRLNQLDKEHLATKARIYDIEQSRRAEDEEAGRRIAAFRQSIDKGGRPADPNAPQQ